MVRNITLLLLLIVSHYALAGIYYVDQLYPNANDQNTGTIDQPWLTITHATATVLAGDTVQVRTGVYHEAVRFDHAGNAQDGHILLSAYPGETPVIDGTGVETTQNGIIIDKDYIAMTGLEIRNWDGNAVWITGAGFTIMSDCDVHDTFFGIGVANGSHDFEFNRVTVHHFTLYGFDVSPSGGSDCYNGVFNSCIAHTGRDPEQNVDGFALGHGTQHDFSFNHCITHDVYDGFDISSKQSTLNGCLAYDCMNGCYKLWQDQITLVNCIGYNGQISIAELDWNGDPGVTSLINCTFFNAGVYTIWIENSADTLHMTNCILAGGDNIGLAFEQPGTGNYTGDYNLFHNDNDYRVIAVAYADEFDDHKVAGGDWTAYSGQDAHSLLSTSVDSILLDPGNRDFHLAPASRAIDAGTLNGAPVTDFDSNARPSGPGIDIGAYEYQVPTQINHAGAVPQDFEIYPNYPNPFNPTTTLNYEIKQQGNVRIDIFNTLGESVCTLFNGDRAPGQYQITWDGTDKDRNPAASGIYFCRIQTRGGEKSVSMLLLR